MDIRLICAIDIEFGKYSTIHQTLVPPIFCCLRYNNKKITNISSESKIVWFATISSHNKFPLYGNTRGARLLIYSLLTFLSEFGTSPHIFDNTFVRS